MLIKKNTALIKKIQALKGRDLIMTPRERVFALLEGRKPDRVPNFNILMAFSARRKGHTYREYAGDYRVLCDCDMACCEAYGIDLLSAISDPMREAGGFGAGVLLPEDGVPYSPAPLVDDLYAAESLLKNYDPRAFWRTEDRLRAVSWFRKAAPDYAVGGWVEGAFAECCDLRGLDNFLADTACEEPEALHAMLRITADQAVRFALEQVREGADIIGIGDAAASLISPEAYREFALPYQKQIVEAVHRAGARTKLHICGNTSRVLPLMLETGTDILDLDWMVDLGRARELLGDRPTILCGNYDPVAVLLQGSPEQVRRAVLSCLDLCPDRYISSAGCEVPRDTPPENLLAVAETLKERAE